MVLVRISVCVVEMRRCLCVAEVRRCLCVVEVRRCRGVKRSDTDDIPFVGKVAASGECRRPVQRRSGGAVRPPAGAGEVVEQSPEGFVVVGPASDHAHGSAGHGDRCGCRDEVGDGIIDDARCDPVTLGRAPEDGRSKGGEGASNISPAGEGAREGTQVSAQVSTQAAGILFERRRRSSSVSRAQRTDQSDLSGPTAAALVAEPGTPSVGAPGLSAVNAVGYRSGSGDEHRARFAGKGTEMGCEHIGGNGDLGIPVLAEAKGGRAGAYVIGVDAGRPDANRDEPGETVGAECRNEGNDRGEGELDAVFDGETGEAGTLPFDPTVRVIKADPTVCLAEIDREQARLNGCAHEILTLLYKDNLQDACNQSK